MELCNYTMMFGTHISKTNMPKIIWQKLSGTRLFITKFVQVWIFFLINFKYLFKLIGLFAKNFCSNAVCNIHAVNCSMSYFCLSKRQWILDGEDCLFLSLPRPSVWPGVGDWSESIHKDSCTLHSLLSRTVLMSHPDKKTSKTPSNVYPDSFLGYWTHLKIFCQIWIHKCCLQKNKC